MHCRQKLEEEAATKGAALNLTLNGANGLLQGDGRKAVDKLLVRHAFSHQQAAGGARR
ncbi:protein of unknown function [Cupriavidus taiwanensis]|nr:protein of unknown function [Cupriavidus taiwanensis]